MENTDNPYLIQGPALISFSGGRTSAYMLRLILDAHGGTLPDDVHVTFANTGKEREETLRFVHECASRWNVHVRWLEWRPPGESDVDKLRFTEVGYNSASRNGEPFKDLMRRKQYLPNSQMRYCTIELKIRVMRDFMRAQGYAKWTNATGLRADEMHRVFKSMERNDSGKERFRVVMPMASSGPRATYARRKPDVLTFWLGSTMRMGADLPQGFDLGLEDHEGNCDICFLKGRFKKLAILQKNPEFGQWWADAEADAEADAKCSVSSGARFDRSESILQLMASAKSNIPIVFDDDDEFDAECGTWCAGDE